MSGNLFAGVWMTGTGTDNNVVAGNYIGTDVTGDVALGNGSVVQYDSFGTELAGGVVIDNGASDNLVGTSGQSADDAGERNIISGSKSDGVEIEHNGTAGNVVAGNYIGTNPVGTAAVENDGQAIFIAEVTTINWIGVNPVYGPENADEGNLISGNFYDAIQFYDATAGVVAGNLMGTNATGSAALPNDDGIELLDTSNVLVGTSGQDGATDDALERNVISGNTRWGVLAYAGNTYAVPNPVASGNVIAGNYIGTNAAGTAAIANGSDGVIIEDSAANNWIGVNSVYGPENSDQRNVISGNSADGVLVTGGGTNANVVAGDYIGLNAAGSAALANGNFGILVNGGAAGTQIGINPSGPNPLERNVISGNGNDGVHIQAAGAGTVIAGNYIGTDATGSFGIGNGVSNFGDGVCLEGDGTAGVTIGGTVNGSANVISGNFAGVLITDSGSLGTSDALVEGNLIGTNASGSAAIANESYGVWVGQSSPAHADAQNTIGGTIAAARNVISGNTLGGVELDGTSVSQTVVEGNVIGTGLASTEAVPNNGPGVLIITGASDNTIGGTAAGAGNTIAFNAGAGVQVGANATDTTTGDAIIENSIFSNSALGIGLGGSSVVPNDSEGHTGPNLFQDFPVISSVVTANGTTTIDGMITEAPNTTYRIEFFGNFTPDPSGYGQGQTFLTFANVTTDSSGTMSFSVALPRSLAGEAYVTATATDPAGNTSEFSADATIATTGGTYMVTTTADSGAGSLRAAIGMADASMGGFTIDFEIPTSDPGYDPSTSTWMIAVASALPALTESTTVDGYSQPGWGPATGYGPAIVLNGTNAGAGADGLDLEADGISVFALLINGFAGDGIDVASNDNTIQDVNLGFAANYASAVPDGVGIYVTGADNLLGTSGQDGSLQDDTEGDYVGGSVAAGIWLSGSGTTGNVIAGSGACCFANGDGLLIDGGAGDNWIGVNTVYGPATADDSDYFANNTVAGVEISGAGTTGNIVAGDNISGNNGDGVLIDGGASNNWIGITPYLGSANLVVNGSLALTGDTLVQNAGAGVVITGAGTSNNVVSGDIINGNSGNGVTIQDGASDNWVGATTLDGAESYLNDPSLILNAPYIQLPGNVMDGDGGAGIEISGSGTTGNVVDDNGMSQSGGDGVLIASGASGNWIGVNPVGGTMENAQQNTIVTNTAAGIELAGSGTTGNVVAGDFVYSNSTDGVLIDSGRSTNWIGVNSVGGSASILQQNVISGNTNAGVEMTGTGTTGNVIAGNDIGTDAAGTAAQANGVGVEIDTGAGGNLVGTSGQDGPADNALERNVISGNSGDGISFVNAGAGNVIAGNYIGTDAAGAAALGNGNFGIDISGGGGQWIGVNPVYGPQDVAERNIISGNRGNAGIEIESNAPGNDIAGNYIGTDVSGEVAVPNVFGIRVYSSGNVIGTDGQDGAADAIEGNLMSGNSNSGMVLEQVAGSNVIAGNFIGVDASGTVGLADGGWGIFIGYGSALNDNMIGLPGAGNVIANDGYGLLNIWEASGTIVQGNMLGTNAEGTAVSPGPMAGGGIEVYDSTDTQIGGTTPGTGNVIAVGPWQSSLTSDVLPVGGFPWAYDGIDIFAYYSSPTSDAGTVIEGNRIGTNAAGTAALGNPQFGIALVDVSDVTIGGTAAGAGNLIAGNSEGGIALLGGAYAGYPTSGFDLGSSDNLIEGNLIGINSSSTAVGNGGPLPGLTGATEAGILINDPSDPLQTSSGNTIGGTAAGAGNVISGNMGGGIVFAGGDVTGNLVAGNFVGTNLQGNAAVGNTGGGVVIESGASANTIGGLAGSSGNLISGNTGDGVAIIDSGTTDNVVAGNLTGLNASGTRPLGNGDDGIGIGGGATGNTIGGTAAGAGNVASGNNGSGIDITGAQTNFNVVVGNFAGTNAAGTAAVANQNAGILIQSGAQDNTIGGSAAADRNLVSGNVLAGIAFYLAGASGNVAEGNWVGLNAGGTGTIANLAGISFTDGASGDTATDNVVSGNTLGGIFIGAYETSTGSSGNLVQGNLIGTDPTGMVALGNVAAGVLIFAASTGNTIGGTASGAGNVISGNTGAGVEISGSGTTGNVVAGNLIGTDVTGTQAIANYSGVEIDSGASGNLIGASGSSSITDPLERNILSGNLFAGVWMTGTGTDNNVVAGNYIGTTISGRQRAGQWKGDCQRLAVCHDRRRRGDPIRRL